MTDITVDQIIATFKNKKRKLILSTAESDDFLDTIKAKKNWTQKEYKKFFYAYSIENKIGNPIDSMRIYNITRKYGFETDWTDYIKIIDSLDTIEKQKEYIDYYFWYYGTQLNQKIYKQLVKKPYFSGLTTASRIKFLQLNIKLENYQDWFDKYFTKEEMIKGLEKNNLFISVRNDKYEISEEKITAIKKFYINKKDLMNNKIKFKFFNQVIKSGSLELVKFCLLEQKIRILNKMHLLWNICSDTASGNVLEILNELHTLGLKLSEKDLIRVQNHNQWEYMENKDQLLLFFKKIKSEKEYNKLIKKYKEKNNKIECKKI